MQKREHVVHINDARTIDYNYREKLGSQLIEQRNLYIEDGVWLRRYSGLANWKVASLIP